MTLRQIDHTAGTVNFRKNFNKRKILEWSAHGALIVFAIWFVTGLVLDYVSHIGAGTPLAP